MIRLEFHRYARTAQGEFIKETSTFIPADAADPRGVPLPEFEGKWILCGIVHPLSDFAFVNGIAKGIPAAQHPLYLGPFSSLPLKTGYQLITQEVFDAGVIQHAQAYRAKQDARAAVREQLRNSTAAKLEHLGLSQEEIALLTR